MERYDRTAPKAGNEEQNSVLIATKRRRSVTLAALSISALAAAPCLAQVNVLTQHNDIARTGQNTSESLLTPANVNSSQFGRLFALPVDGHIYAQPLYMSGVQIPGAGTHNVVFAATEHDSVYAFDADSNGGSNASPLWKASLLDTAHGAAAGATTVSSQEICEDIVPEYGITGTPVIDPVAGILYVVSFTKEGASYVLRLHALNVTTGAEMLGGPVVLQAQVPGVGNGSSGGVLKFDPRWEHQRPGLLLLNGVVYVGFASHADNGDWHGWVLSYNASTLAQLSAYCNSPNGTGSGVWMSGDGLAADVVDPAGHPFGRMFLVTGNGDYGASTPYTNNMDYGDSLEGLDLTNGILTVKDEFTPSIQATLNSSDGDQASGGIVVLPDQSGAYSHLLVQEGKSGKINLVNRDQMGGYGSTDNIVQYIDSTGMQSGIWGGPAYWNGNVYTGEVRNPIKARSLVSGVMSVKPTSSSPDTYGFPGPTPSISSQGTANGILWAINTNAYTNDGSAILNAYDATNLATKLYSSTQVPSRDSAGAADKFMVPTIANGKVFVGTGEELDVYGLFSSEPVVASPVISPGSTSFSSPVQVTITDATPGAVIYYTTDGTAPTTASTVYTGQLTVNSTETITAIAVAPGYVWITPVSATYTSLNNTANPVFTPPGGTFSTSPSVTITDASASAVIYYTTDGSMPSSSSTVYANPIPITGSTTVRAIAFAPGLSGSSVVTQTYVTQSGVDFSQGFSQAQAVMTFNGSTGLDDSRLQLTNGYTNDTGSAFVTAPVNIQAFTTDFLFQLSNPQADGITFTIQGQKPTALGQLKAGGIEGAGLGYASIPNSIAIKFDFHSDSGEGNDSTGVYINGATPSIPAIDLTHSGINLQSGDSMAVHLTYDGVNLAMTITDAVTAATWSSVWRENIPQIVGGNTAYVGFTGATQVLTASQKIATWTYTSTTPGQPSTTATPTVTPASGSYATAQTVNLSDATSGAVIYYTTDGTTPTTSSNLYSGPFSAPASERIQAMAVVPGGAVSGLASTTLAIASGNTSAVPNYSSVNGFASGPMILNGPAFISSPVTSNGKIIYVKALQLTDGSLNEARSAYFSNAVNIQKFTTDFDFQLLTASAEGFTFVVQNQGLTAVGSNGGGLGYGLLPDGTGASIGNSVAVKFDIHANNGESANSVGVYVNGASPTVPSTTLSGVTLNSGDILHAHIVYDGTNLKLTITDATTGGTATSTYPVNIPSAIGGNLAYIGFTAATGATGAVQNILDWTYGNYTVTTAVPAISPGGGSFASPTVATISDATPGAVIYYTTDGSVPTTASSVYNGQLPVNATGTIMAIAQAPGDGVSGVASASFTVQTPAAQYSPGFTTLGLALNGGATVNGGVLQITDGGANEARSAYFSTLVNIQAFTTDFDFQLLSAVSDGFTFVIQNQGLTALGTNGGGLGYGVSPTGGGNSIKFSAAVKFDFHSNSGEGNNSTGLYLNGSSPTTPATNLTGTGVQLSSGHVIHAHIVYDGKNLTLTLTDSSVSPAATATATYPVDLPATVNGNYAYVGFTGGTGGSSAVQNILDWTYSATPPSSTAVPVISPNGGSFSAPQVATISDATSGAVIYYTTDGSTPTVSSTVYSAAIPVNSTEKLQAIAKAPGAAQSGAATASFTIQAPSISYSSSFNAAGMTMNGATINGGVLQLTDGGTNEARTAYFSTPVNVQSFATDFDFQLLSALADGFTFVIQNQGLTAVGTNGGGLGYGVSPTGAGKSIGKSVAVKFDLHSNSGEGTDSTGLYSNGASPTLPATNLGATGVQLNSGHAIHAHIVYDGTNLTLTLTDSSVSPAATATAMYAVNIPATVGGNTAYVGFTGGTGGTSAVQNILDWTFASTASSTPIPTFSLPSGTYTGVQTVSIADAMSQAVIYYTTDGTTPTLSSPVYTSPVTVAKSTTLQAMAIASGQPQSAVNSALYSIQPAAPSYASGFQSVAQLALNGSTVTGGLLQLTDGGTNEARSAYFTNPVNVRSFTTDFDFQLLSAVADGFTFVVQNQGLTAIGTSGGGLGYGTSPSGAGISIGKSVAVKFDLHSNSGEGTDSTGLYLNGVSPTLPATNLSATGVQLNSGHVLHAHIVYDGTNLTLTLTDSSASPAATATATYPVNIPAMVGGNTAYVGFTGGTGSTSAVQNILDWTWTNP